MALKDFLGGDYTPLEHAGLALAMQLGVLVLFFWVDFYAALAAGSLLGVGFFIGREHAQAEKRWKKEWGEGTIWNAFDMRRWDVNSRWDLLCPMIACTISAFLILVLYTYYW